MEIFTSFLESPLGNSVDNADTMTHSEHVDEEHEVPVVVLILRELDDDNTGHE